MIGSKDNTKGAGDDLGADGRGVRGRHGTLVAFHFTAVTSAFSPMDL
jgi:hypothetical protein